MNRALSRLFLLACLSLFHAEANAGRPSPGTGAPGSLLPRTPRPASVRVDAREALRRARLEHALIRAEKTAVLLGELAAVRDLSQ